MLKRDPREIFINESKAWKTMRESSVILSYKKLGKINKV